MRFFVTYGYFGNIAYQYPPHSIVAQFPIASEHYLFDQVCCIKVTLCTNDVSAFPLLYITTGYRGIRCPKTPQHITNGHTIPSKRSWCDRYGHLPLGFAVNIHTRNTFDALYTFLDHVDQKISVRRHRPRVAFLLRDHKPCYGIIIGAGCRQHRFVSLFRVIGYTVKSVSN